MNLSDDFDKFPSITRGTYKPVARGLERAQGMVRWARPFLLVPTGKKPQKRPAVLALHPTDMQFGNRVVVEPLRDHYRAYGKDLAERGYVVLAPAYPLMANYQPDLNSLGYKSGTMKAIWDNIRGLDLLASLRMVDSKRIAAIGHSLGGHNAIYTAVF